MIVNIDEFYNNNNYKQYVPLEAFQNELKLVGKTLLKDVEVENVLSITYSIDDYGENPLYIEYIDKQNRKHIVKLKPAIREELDTILSKYATIDYTNQKFIEAVQTSKDYTDQAKEALTVLINGSKEEAIQVSKAYTDVEINKAKQEVKDYADSQLTNYETKADASIDHSKLATVPSGHVTPYISWFPNIDSNYIRLVHDQEEIKMHINNSQTNREDIGYLSRRNPSNFATTADLEPTTEKLSNIWGGHKAPFIYWIPNIDVNTMKLENTENDVKVTLNDGDVVYWRKNEYQPVDLSGIEEGDVQTLADANAYTDTQLTNYETKADASIDHSKLATVPSGHVTPYISWFPNIDSNYIRLVHDQEEIKMHINNSQTNREDIGYLSRRNPSNFATKTEAENANKVYGYDNTSDTWSKCDGNFTVFHNNSNITKLGYRQTTGGVEKTVDFNDFATKLDSLFFRGNIGAQNPSLNNLEQGFYHFYFENENTDSTYPEDMQGQVSLWGSILQMGYTSGLCTQIMIRVPGDVMYIRTHPNGSWNSWHKVTAPLANVNAEMLNLETVEAVAQEQNATNTESVAVSLRQKTRAVREVTNNSTLVNTKDFLILNLDFSFVPNTIPTSVESMFIENIAIDAPEFDGKSFDITFKANEHSVISKGVIGEPLTIKMCAFPVDETIQSVKVVVKDKIIIRKETE